VNARPSPFRVSLLVVVAAAIVLLASLLAYEAHDATRSERLTADRALDQYAAMAASEFRDAFRQRWMAGARQALGAGTAGLATSAFEPLAPLAALGTGVATALPCARGADTRRVAVRLDLRQGEAQVAPPPARASERERLVETVRRAARQMPPPEDPYLLAVADESTYVVVGARFVRLGAPIGLYALTVCASAIERVLPDEIVRRQALLPASIAGTGGNTGLLHLRLRRADSTVVWAAGQQGDTPHRAALPLEEAGLALEVSLEAAAGDRLAVGPPARSRLPLLTSLLVLTVALGAVALVQLRREHELAHMRADFTSSVSHELRTPLTQIMLYGETLQLGRARTADERRLAADVIVQEAGRLMHLVENLLSFARLRRGAERPRLRATNLGPAAAATATTFRPLAVSAHATLVSEETDVWASVDPAWFRQVLLNLLDNAVKYGPAGQTVRVRTSREGDRARLTVTDEGQGIPATDRERIWMPYVRLERGERGGTGLGLTVVRELVDSMQGRVWVEDAPHGGSSFVVEWDAVAPPMAEAAPEPERAGVAT
jgi:signal transduction histidine kinase